MEKITSSFSKSFWLGVVFIMITTLVFSTFLPWWGFLIFAFVAGFFVQQSHQASFICGLLGVGGAFLLKMFDINAANEGILAEKIATLFGLPGTFSLMVVIVLLFGLLGGLAVWSGKLIREQLSINN